MGHWACQGVTMKTSDLVQDATPMAPSRPCRRVAAARAIVLLAALLFAACAKPLPAEYTDYAGEWRGPGVVLRITHEGHVIYARKGDNERVSIDAPIHRFDGDDFEVGLAPLVTRFDVTARPALVDGVWRMTVDGRVLTRRDDAPKPPERSGEETLSL